MKRTLTVLAAALVALPVFAGQPTPTPVPKQPQKAQKGRVLQQQGKQTQPTTVATPEPVGAVTFGRDKMASREAMTPSPSVERGKPTKDQKQEQPQPTPAPVGSINLNSSRSNRVARPTVTMTPSVERGKPTKEQKSSSSE
jgi:hypothetical protein